MIEFIINKNNNEYKIKEEDENSIVSSIVNMFYTFNNCRKTNLEKAEKLTNKIFFEEKKQKDADWKFDVNLCKTYMFYATLKSYIWKSVYANVNSMFDVSGENAEADNLSNKQKANLVNILEKGNFQIEFDQIIEYSLFSGELIAKVTWKKQVEQFRKKVPPVLLPEQEYPQELINAYNSGKTHYIDEKEIFNNPCVEAVNPINFAFDTNNKNFNAAAKIHKIFKTPDEIINNKQYRITEELKENIYSLTSEYSNTPFSDEELIDKEENSNTVEVLDFWGDFRFKNAVLRNYHIVIVGRKYLVYMAENERITSPFVFATYLKDPKTKRGISPLYATCPLADLQEDLMQRTCNLQALVENPPVFAPRGFFDKKKNSIEPGLIIEYGDSLNPDKIKPMTFNANVYLQDISFISDSMADISGIYPNMIGAPESGNKTATEINKKSQGQSTRLSYLIDTINQDLVIPIVQKVAKLSADFKSGIEEIFLNSNNKKETLEIDDNVRQAEYRYTYSDRSATAEKSEKADLVVSASKEFANFLPLNANELYTWYLEQKEVDNPERFINQTASIPQEVQQVLLQNPQVQELCQQWEQAKNGQGL